MKLLILGDVVPTEVTDPLFDQQDKETLFTDFLGVFKQHDFTFVNLECALTKSDHAIEKFGPNLKACKNTAFVLKDVGVDCIGLSNNHIFDFGIEGYRDTIEALEEAGLDYTGFGENYEDSRTNYYIDDAGKKICIIDVCEHEYSYALEDRMGSRPFDPFDTLDDIRDAKKECDRVIVIYHGGKEHCYYPSPRLRKVCRAMIKAGADLVTTQHSHCIGCYEPYEGGHILYGQGNFHFVGFRLEDVFPHWKNSLAISYDSQANTVEFIPHCNEGKGITLAKGAKKEEIMTAFEERNASLQDGSWLEGWRAFCETMRKSFTGFLSKTQVEGARKKDNDLFGHLIDCEAHEDVLRELFPTANQTNEK